MENIDLEKHELFSGRFYPAMPNKGHNCRKSWSKTFEVSTLGATNVSILDRNQKIGKDKALKGHNFLSISCIPISAQAAYVLFPVPVFLALY